MIGSLLNTLIPGLTDAVNAAYPTITHGLNILLDGLETLLGSILHGLTSGA